MRTNKITAFVFLFLLLFLFSSTCWGDLLALKSGKFVHAQKIHSFTDLEVSVEMFGGGIVRLQWDQIKEEDAKALRRKLGIDSDEKEGVFLDGYQVILRTGSMYRGVLQNESAHFFTLKNRSGTVRLPLTEIETKETLRLNALEVYEPRFLYGERIEKNPPETPEDHFATAQYCRLITAYEEAKAHLEACEELDPEFKADERKTILDTLEVLIINKEFRNRIEEIKRLVRIGEFDQAIAALVAFQEECKVEAFLKELERDGYSEERLAAKKQRVLEKKVVRHWHLKLAMLARKKIQDPETTLKDAAKYASKEMTKDIKKAVAQQLEIDEGLVEELWRARKGGSKRKISYGTGTFIVEKNKRKKSTLKTRKKSGGLFGLKTSKNKSRSRDSAANRKLRKKLESLRLTPDKWWRESSVEPRKAWLMAYYVEKSGTMDVLRTETRLCFECSGKGFREVIQGLMGDQGYMKVVCKPCQGIGTFKVLVYR